MISFHSVLLQSLRAPFLQHFLTYKLVYLYPKQSEAFLIRIQYSFWPFANYNLVFILIFSWTPKALSHASSALWWSALSSTRISTRSSARSSTLSIVCYWSPGRWSILLLHLQECGVKLKTYVWTQVPQCLHHPVVVHKVQVRRCPLQQWPCHIGNAGANNLIINAYPRLPLIDV